MKKNNKGFSLLEILVAMALVALIFSMVANFNFTSKQASEELIDDLTLAIDSATDEAALRNSNIRINFELSDPKLENKDEVSIEDQTQSILFEYALDSNELLEVTERANRSDLTQTQLEKFIENQKSQKSNYARLSSLKNGKINVEYPVKILGIGYPNDNKFISTLSSSIYFYPDGDKDPAIVFITEGQQIHYLVIPQFGLNIKYDSVLIESSSTELDFEELIEKARTRAKELFEKIRLETN
jgi:prepilin-type N-terminal cleavage/methylation domain-containing protein